MSDNIKNENEMETEINEELEMGVTVYEPEGIDSTGKGLLVAGGLIAGFVIGKFGSKLVQKVKDKIRARKKAKETESEEPEATDVEYEEVEE